MGVWEYGSFAKTLPYSHTPILVLELLFVKPDFVIQEKFFYNIHMNTMTNM